MPKQPVHPLRHPQRPETKIAAALPKLVEMGRISAPFGIKGWIRVQTYTRAVHGTNSLATYPVWWISGDGGWREVKVEQSQAQGADVVAKLAGMDDRDEAAALKGQQVAVARDALPPAAKGEFYWADLVGLRVRNTEGLELGVVSSMMETGANDVMVVQQSTVDGGKDLERLIPFIADVIKRVDIAASLIEVEWGADY